MNYREVKASERLPKVPGYYTAFSEKNGVFEWEFEGEHITHIIPDTWLEPLPTISEGEMTDVIWNEFHVHAQVNKYTANKAAKAVINLINKDR